ncbi:hypothetical protein SB751_00015 [Cupriavidus sp. SIMBA_020]|uniref:hypothetical protein n=1 Tax=Cupriavidus sp. SIMBA_020 TaxID=3085766 RepID=UPI00397E1D1A
MIKHLKKFTPKLKKTAAAAAIGGVLALSAAPAAFAQTSTDGMDEAIAEAKSSALTTVAKFTAPLLLVAAAGVGVGVGVKYVKKFRGAA